MAKAAKKKAVKKSAAKPKKAQAKSAARKSVSSKSAPNKSASGKSVDVNKLAAEVRAMRKELTHVHDRQGILDAVCTYARGLDRHDYELFATTYWPDAVDNHGDWVGYIPEFVQWGIDLHNGYKGHTHNMTTHYAEIDGNEAHSESYVLFVLSLADGRSTRVGGGRYIDRLEKRNGVWRIMLRRMVIDWRFIVPDGTGWGQTGMQSHIAKWGDKNDLAYMRPLTLSPELQKKLDAKGPRPKAK